MFDFFLSFITLNDIKKSKYCFCAQFFFLVGPFPLYSFWFLNKDVSSTESAGAREQVSARVENKVKSAAATSLRASSACVSASSFVQECVCSFVLPLCQPASAGVCVFWYMCVRKRGSA